MVHFFKEIEDSEQSAFLATLFIFALGYRPTLLGHTTG